MANDETLLTEIRENFDYSYAYWRDIYQEMRIDMRFVAGDPWDARERLARETPGQERPCLTFDELGQYCNQIINDVRINKRAISVIPRGNGSDDKKAELRAGVIRDIEYESNAQSVYIGAFQDAVQGSIGFAKAVKRYVSPGSFDQELRIVRISNPGSVLVDPDCKEADFSDMQFAFEIERMKRKKFIKEFPDAKVTSFTSEMISDCQAWFGDDDLQIASYWHVKKKKRKLLGMKLFDGGESSAYFDDMKAEGFGFDGKTVFIPLPTGYAPFAEILRERMDEVPEVYQCVTNGIEILKKIPWDGKYIPIAVTTGKEIYVDDGSGVKRKLLSAVRLARDPYMLYCYYRSTEAEVVGQTPKTPYIGYVGQFKGRETDWENINRVPLPYLEANAFTEATGNQVLPLPQKTQYEPPIQALNLGAEGARRAIQAAMGISALPTAAQRQNEKSGVALERIASQQSQGSFHFVDNYEQNFLKQMGRILDDLLEKTYDTPRELSILGKDDSRKILRINEESEDEATGETVRHEFGPGTYGVTISTGPSFESQRDESNQFLNSLAGTPMGPMVMDLIVKMKNLGPIGDEIAKRLTPPEVAAQQEMGDIPPAIQQKLMEYQQALEALNAHAAILEQQNKVLQSDLLKQALDNEGKYRVELLKIKGDLLLKAVDSETADSRMVKDAVIQTELRRVESEIGVQAQAQSALLSQAITPEAEEKPLQNEQ